MASDQEFVLNLVTGMLDSLAIPYFVGGSVASSIHGIPRMTQDIDLVADLLPGRVPALVSRAQGAFYVEESVVWTAVREAGTFNLIHLETMVKVDVFVRQRSAWADAQWSRRLRVKSSPEADAPEVNVASAEDMVLQKLEWYRLGSCVSERQWKDVVGILKVRAAMLDVEYLEQWAERLGLRELLDQAVAEARAEREGKRGPI